MTLAVCALVGCGRYRFDETREGDAAIDADVMLGTGPFGAPTALTTLGAGPFDDPGLGLAFATGFANAEEDILIATRPDATSA